MAKYKHFLGLGIAGNFALHLDQAGEAEDFKDVITADEAAPKGMFPFYLPQGEGILSTYPLSSSILKLPKEAVNVQAEPEVGLVCNLEYTAGKLTKIIPTHFGAYNDSSIRVKGAKKISDKKNWGDASKGLADTLVEIDSFAEGGVMDSFSICSFLRRNGEVHAYGENVEIKGYSYFYSKLTDWMVKQINIQEDFGPLEPLSEYIQAIHYPQNAIISIGATRYTEYGESTFLQAEDEVIVILYNHKETSYDLVIEAVETKNYDTDIMSVLTQKVIEKESNE